MTKWLNVPPRELMLYVERTAHGYDLLLAGAGSLAEAAWLLARARRSAYDCSCQVVTQTALLVTAREIVERSESTEICSKADLTQRAIEAGLKVITPL